MKQRHDSIIINYQFNLNNSTRIAIENACHKLRTISHKFYYHSILTERKERRDFLRDPLLVLRKRDEHLHSENANRREAESRGKSRLDIAGAIPLPLARRFDAALPTPPLPAAAIPAPWILWMADKWAAVNRDVINERWNFSKVSIGLCPLGKGKACLSPRRGKLAELFYRCYPAASLKTNRLWKDRASVEGGGERELVARLLEAISTWSLTTHTRARAHNTITTSFYGNRFILSRNIEKD